MKNTLGNQVTVTLFGESHGEMIGCVMDGLPAGIEIEETFIEKQMSKRKAVGSISTSRNEDDVVNIVSGVYNGRTTGTPLTMTIINKKQQSKDYENMSAIARPSHADYTAEIKYGGYQDYRGGGHFSGRLTAPIVAAGSIALKMLKSKNIEIGTHLLEVYGIRDDSFSGDISQICSLNDKYFAVINDEVGQQMIQEIEKAKVEKDSVGGILESLVIGLEAGIGEPTFDSLEGLLAHGLLSIGGIKGVEFGSGFELAKMRGSKANDSWVVDDGVIKTISNHSGGINGGISNGMPLLIRTVVKPTASISKLQNTVNFKTNENVQIEISGRHDPAIIHRARVVQDSIIALVLVDVITARKGTEWWNK